MSTPTYIFHWSIGVLTLEHTGSAIVIDNEGVVFGFVVGEAFQHPSHLTRSIRLQHQMLPDSSSYLCHHARHLFIHTLTFFDVAAFASADLLILHSPTIATAFSQMFFFDTFWMIVRHLAYNLVDNGSQQ